MIRTVVFGSFLRGFFVLSELLRNPHLRHFEVVGLATDDPERSFVRPERRVWQYPEARNYETLISSLARVHKIPTYARRIDTFEFQRTLESVWRPDIILMATFGQMLPPPVFSFPKYGAFNLHPCTPDPWPNYRGGNPFREMIRDGRTETVIAMHEIDDLFDHGPLVGYSEPVAIPPGASIVDMHKFTSPVAAQFLSRQLLSNERFSK